MIVKVKYGNIRTRGTKNENRFISEMIKTPNDICELADFCTTRRWSLSIRQFVYCVLHGAFNALVSFTKENETVLNLGQNISYKFKDFQDLQAQLPMDDVLNGDIYHAFPKNFEKCLPFFYQDHIIIALAALENNNGLLWQNAFRAISYIAHIQRLCLMFTLGYYEGFMDDLLILVVFFEENTKENTELRHDLVLRETLRLLYDLMLGAINDPDFDFDFNDIHGLFTLAFVEAIKTTASLLDIVPQTNMMTVVNLLQMLYQGGVIENWYSEYGFLDNTELVPHEGNLPIMFV